MLMCFVAFAQDGKKTITMTMDVESLGLQIWAAKPDGLALPGVVVKDSISGTTLKFERGEGKGNPTYKQLDGVLTHARVYPKSGSTENGNIMTISSGMKVVKVTATLAYDKPSNCAISCSEGEVSYPDATHIVWEGESSNLILGAASTDATNSWVYIGIHKFEIELIPDAGVDAVIVGDKSKKTYKTIENGQIVIVRDGVKYNLLGVRIN